MGDSMPYISRHLPLNPPAGALTPEECGLTSPHLLSRLCTFVSREVYLTTPTRTELKKEGDVLSVQWGLSKLRASDIFQISWGFHTVRFYAFRLALQTNVGHQTT